MENMNEEQQKALRRNQILASIQKKSEPKPKPVELEPVPEKKKINFSININKNYVFSTIAFLIVFTIIALPKVNLIKYNSTHGTVETFYVTSDILGIHDSQILDTTFYDSIQINEHKRTISFCSKKHKDVKCYNTMLVERKGFFSSIGSYLSYINNQS